MNLYRICTEYLDLQVSLFETLQQKENANSNENFEEVAELYKKELKLVEQVDLRQTILLELFADKKNLGVSSRVFIPFKRSMFENDDLKLDLLRNKGVSSTLRKSRNFTHPNFHQLQTYVYYSVDNWKEFFMERQEWLEKQAKRPTQPKVVIEELTDIKLAFADNWKVRHQ